MATTPEITSTKCKLRAKNQKPDPSNGVCATRPYSVKAARACVEANDACNDPRNAWLPMSRRGKASMS